MFKKLSLLALLVLMVFGASALAADLTGEVFYAPDQTLSIQAPNPTWHYVKDSERQFTITDNLNTITISHMRNGEPMQSLAVADQVYGAVYQAYISTSTEVFCVRGCARAKSDLQMIMDSIHTIKILALDSLNNGPVAGGTAPIAGGDPNAPVIPYVGTVPIAGGSPNATVAQQSENVANAPFTVFSRDGAYTVIQRQPDGTYKDAWGAVYLQTPKGMYVRDDNNMQYSADPNYWNQVREQEIREESEQAASEAFTVYDRSGNPVWIQRQAIGNYADANGRTYVQTPNGLYVCNQTDTTYSADPNYWDSRNETNEQGLTPGEQQDIEEIERNAADREQDPPDDEDADQTLTPEEQRDLEEIERNAADREQDPPDDEDE